MINEKKSQYTNATKKKYIEKERREGLPSVALPVVMHFELIAVYKKNVGNALLKLDFLLFSSGFCCCCYIFM